MASPTQWTWIWVTSGSWWWTGRPGVLQSMRFQRVGHDWATELNWKSCSYVRPHEDKSCTSISPAWLPPFPGAFLSTPQGNPKRFWEGYLSGWLISISLRLSLNLYHWWKFLLRIIASWKTASQIALGSYSEAVKDEPGYNGVRGWKTNTWSSIKRLLWITKNRHLKWMMLVLFYTGRCKSLDTEITP